MMKPRYDFSLYSSRYLNSDGKLLAPPPEWSQNLENLIDAYKQMVLIRAFDQKCIALQRTGQLGTYPSLLGQEAISVAIGNALKKDDVFVPYYRDQAAQYLHGVSLVELLQYWGGDERGSAYQNCPQDLPICVPIATQYGHAAGIASAIRIRQEERAVLVSGGDGSTSKGDFLESLNLSGAWNLPLVFVVVNNQWAISTPRHLQCKAETLAQKAIGAGIHGVIVDGNDYIACYDEVQQALEKARAGRGPSLIEAVTYRLGDHTTADDASRYRSQADLEEAWSHEPILRLKAYLEGQGAWNEQLEKEHLAGCKTQIEEIVNTYKNIPPAPATDMFEHLYAELPPALSDQYQEVQATYGQAVKTGEEGV